MDDMDERERKLPEFERDDERTVGGGLMSQGGTAIDRGTGELDGTAQGGETDDDEEEETTEGQADDVGPGGRIFPAPAAASGAAGAPFVAAIVDDEDRRDRDDKAPEG